jgi:hypothetical protein
MSILTENKKWEVAKARLTEGLTGNRKDSLAIVLENQRKWLVEAATAGATNAGNIAALNKVILPVIRRVMPTVIANEIIGVQPMTGPVGQIHTIRMQYADTVPSAGTGAVSGDEALSPFNIELHYSGNENVSNPRAAKTAALEGRMGNRMNIRLLKETVEAESRRLSATWTIESMQDAQSQHGIDIEAELMAVLAQEITAEIDQEILNNLRTLAGSAAVTFDQSAVSGVATSVVDEHAALAVLINQQANRISQRTRRGAGNWCVLNPLVVTVLQSAGASAFARTTEGTFEAPTNTKFIGTLNGTMRVYVDTYAGDNVDVLVGYKGASEQDAAAFYCPYIPLMSSGSVMDPGTGEMVTTFLTRYGYLELKDQASSLGNAADYLGKVAVSNLRFF